MSKRDHGGNLDAAMAQFGGARSDWLDLSTGINPVPYPVGDIPEHAWASLPDQTATDALISAARKFWNVPDTVGVLPAPGASAIIAHLPHALAGSRIVSIARPTYNEWQASFDQAGWAVSENGDGCDVVVRVHPNNPDGRYVDAAKVTAADDPSRPFMIFDESFCDIARDASMIRHAEGGNVAIVKSFGKFWGLAGVRLGCLIGPQDLLDRVAALMGPWPVSGLALALGARAFSDEDWARRTVERLEQDSDRLDALMTPHCLEDPQGTPLFRLYTVSDAAQFQAHLARHHIWSRIFPYSENWVRLGLPHPDRWGQLEAALK